MGKRLKKGRGPSVVNLKAAVSKKVTEKSGESVEIAEGVVAAVPEKRSCVHFDNGVNLDKLLEKIKVFEPIKCGDCKEGLRVKKASKRKNGVSSPDSKPAKKAIWVCLDCGHFFCGGVGLPNGVQSHVLRHIRVTRHRLVMQCEKTQLRWCFPCQSLLPFESEEHGEKKDLLLEVVKVIKERSSNTASASADTEDLCSGRGSIFSETKLEGVLSSGVGGKDGYAVRGLVNLGNTCFFNSVLQNLLSLHQLREHFLKDDLSGSGGPLVSSLKKLFAETKSEAGLVKSAINPRAFFGCVCSKAPQFKGYQQHDSHELLRYLLDSLSTEESSLRKKLGVSNSVDSSTHQKPTLIDSLFGGEISSTVSCLECGHSSKVYEPFLDLSLPVPSNKPPPKKQQTISQEKKGKIPPKQVVTNGAVSKYSGTVSAKPTMGKNTTVSVLETPSAMALDNIQASEIATQIDTECGNWLDFVEPEPSHNEADLVLQGDVADCDPTTEVEAVVPGPEIPASAPVSSDGQTLEVSTETLMHDNDGSAKPEPVPDDEDALATDSDQDTAASGISAKIDEAQVCGDPYLGQSSSSANPWADEELAYTVAASEVLYLPYKDDISCDDKTVPGPEIPASAPVSSDDQTLVVSTETLMHDNDGNAKPEPVPDDEDALATHSDQDTAASGISAKIDEAQVCGDPYLGQSSSSANPWADEELPSMVAASEVLYLPYKDDISCDDKTVAEGKGEASSSFVSGHHEQTVDYVDFSSFWDEPDVSCNDKTVKEGEGEASSSFVSDSQEQNVDYIGFGSLFEEPEISEGPVFGPPSKAEVSEAGFMAVSSDSDPEELDDSGSPVSVDRCLALFTKPEILSDDNAWHCENCSKNLKLQRLREKRTTKEGLGNGWVGESGTSSASDECKDNPSNQTCTDFENGYKPALSTGSPNFKGEKNAIANDILGDTDTKQPPFTSSATETRSPGEETTSSQSANGYKFEASEDVAVDSENVIVKRDASKRVLVNRAPPVLTIHLKRFSQDARGRLSKLSGHVVFKEFIDLGQYMDSRLTREDDQPVYRLSGLVEHSGTMRRGHYVAYIRGGHKERRNSDIKESNTSIWYYASDSCVRRASIGEVLRSEAYILFYERI